MIYARTDQLIAGLDRAVDPTATATPTTRRASRSSGWPSRSPPSPTARESRAVAGALALDTLVVAPAGNDGAAGPLYGSSPGRAARRRRSPSARPTSAATSPRARRHAPRARRALDGICRCSPRRARRGARRRPAARRGTAGDGLVRPRGSAPWPAVRRSSRGRRPARVRAARRGAGAAAVLVYGKTCRRARSGSRDGRHSRRRRARAAAHAAPSGRARSVAIAAARTAAEQPPEPLAPFSSRGLTFGAVVKPDLTAPGAALGTSDPGRRRRRLPRQRERHERRGRVRRRRRGAARPGPARPRRGRPAQPPRRLRAHVGAAADHAGLGEVDVGASAAAELVAERTSLAFGAGTARGLARRRGRSVCATSRRRRLTVFVRHRPRRHRPPRARCRSPAGRVVLEPGGSRAALRGAGAARCRSSGRRGRRAGTLTRDAGRRARRVRVPWAVRAAPRPRACPGLCSSSRKRAFKPSETEAGDRS